MPIWAGTGSMLHENRDDLPAISGNNLELLTLRDLELLIWAINAAFLRLGSAKLL